MKKFATLLAFCFLAIAGQAQVQKGAKLIDVGLGGISYSKSDYSTSYSSTPTVYNSDGHSFSVSLYPTAAFFLADNLAVGASLSLGWYSSTSTSSNTGSATTSEYTSNSPSFYLGPMVRYYIGKSEKGRPFAEINGSYGLYFGKSKSTSSSGSSSETTTKPKGDWDAGISCGYELFLNQNIGLYATVGASYGKSKDEYEYVPSSGSGYTYTQEYNNLYFPVTFGIQIHLVPATK